MKSTILLTAVLFLSVSCTSQDAPKEILDMIYYDRTEFSDTKHRLNLVLADQPDSPLLLWIHGGAWSAGDRKDEMPLARKLAERGISVAVMSYRLSPAEFRDPPKKEGVQHPAHIQDVARAFRWLYDHAATYNYSTDKLFVSGFSAGGHLSALLAMDDRYLKEEGLNTTDIRGCIPISGAYDIPKYFAAIDSVYNRTFAVQHVNGVFGPDDQFQEASPVTYIEKLDVPMMVLTDGALSLYANTFKAALAAKGREDIPFRYYESLSHAEMYQDLMSNGVSKPREELIAFIKKHAE